MAQRIFWHYRGGGCCVVHVDTAGVGGKVSVAQLRAGAGGRGKVHARWMPDANNIMLGKPGAASARDLFLKSTYRPSRTILSITDTPTAV